MRYADYTDVPFEHIERMAERCRPVRDQVIPLLGELKEVVRKGNGRSLNDMMYQARLEEMVMQRLERIIAGNVSRFVSCVGSVMDSVDGETSQAEGIEDIDMRDLLRNVYTDGHSFATCDARMIFTEWGAGDFVHGPDALFPVVQIAEKILQEGERIDAIERFSWRKPLKNDIKLAVYDKEMPDMDKTEFVMEGSLRTSEGRVLSVMAMDNPEKPIEQITANNPFAVGTIIKSPSCYSIEDGGIHSFEIFEPKVLGCYEAFNKNKSLSVGTLVEILTLALINVDSSENSGSVLRMLGGISDLPIPKDMRDIFVEGSRLEVRFLPDQKKKGRSGLELVPFEFKFPHQETFARGIYAITGSEDLANKHCEE